jgi:LemA protein
MGAVAALVVAVGVLALAALWAARVRARLMQPRRRIVEALAQMESHLHERYDMVEQVVDAASKCLTREHVAVSAAALARERALAAAVAVAAEPVERTTVRALARAESELRAALDLLQLEIEHSADMASRRAIEQLMDRLVASEDRVGAMRQAYNDEVLTYNTQRQVFPANLVASACDFGPAQPFNGGNGTRELPTAAAIRGA